MAGDPIPEGWTEEPVGGEEAVPAGWTEEPVSPAAVSPPVPRDVAPSITGFTADDVATDAQLGDRTSRHTRLRLAFDESRRTSEDDAATTLAVAKQLGVPFDTVRKNLPAFKETAAAASWDPAEWETKNPELAKLVLTNPELGPLVLRSKETGPLVRAFRAAGDWLQDAYQKSLEGTPEQVAAEQARAREFAIVPGTEDMAAAGVTPLTPEQVAERERQRAKRDAPKLALERDDPKAQLVREDTSFGGRLLLLGLRAAETKRALDLSRKQVRLMLAENGLGGDAAELAAELHDAKLQNTPRAYGDDSGLLRDVTEGLQGAVSTVDVGADALKGAGVAGGIGGISGAIIGGLVTKTPAGVLEGAGIGARTLGGPGARAGAFLSAMEIETGTSHEALRDLVTDKHQKLTPGEAMGGAVVQGLIKGGLEFVSFGQSTKVLKQALPSQITGLIAKDPTFRALLGRVAAEYGKSVATEGITEGLQDAVEQVGDYVQASLKDDALQAKGYDPTRGLEAVQGGIAGAVLSGGVTSGLALVTTRTSTARAEMADRQVGPLLELAQQPAVKAAPEAFAQLIAEASAEGGHAPLAALHVDAHAVVKYFQEQGFDGQATSAAVAELLGPEAPAKLLDAAASGGKLEVPVEAVLSKWGSSEVGKALVDDTTTDPGALTPRQRAEQKAEIDAQAEAIAKDVEAKATEAELLATRTRELEQQLVETGQSKQAAKAGAALVRAFMATQQADFGKALSEVFPATPVAVAKGDEMSVGADAMAQLPTETLTKRAAAVDAQTRATELFIDPVSGLRNRRAWDESPRKAGAQVAVITSPDIKALNDDPKGGHDTANELLRLIGGVVGGIDAEAARSGTNFLLHAKNREELRAAVNAIRAKLPAGLTVEGALAPDIDAAFKKLDTTTDTKRDAGKLPARGKTTFDLSTLGAETFAAGKPAAPNVSPELLAAAEALTPEDFERTAYRDKDIPSILSKTGFDAAPAARFVSAFDLRGLKKINESIGKAAGDALLRVFGEAAMRAGGKDVSFAHLSGDEYAAKHDNRAELESFEARLKAELQRVGVDATLDGEDITIRAGFRSGIGEKTYGAADRALNAAKREEAPAGNDVLGSGGLPGAEPRREVGGAGRDGGRQAGVGEAGEVVRLAQDDLQAVLDSAAAAGVKLDVSETRVITVSRIVVPESARGQGIGTKVMKDLIAYADRVRKPIALTPSSDFGGSVPRLKKFYKSLGFIENKGRARLQSVNDSMVRPAPPGSPVVYQDTSTTPKGYTELPAGRALQSTIRVFLNKSADVSTVIHESGHAFLEQLFDLAERPDAPQRTKDTAAAALKALGVESRREVKREQHEKFARAFEKYVFEGQAPSSALKQVFARFTRWLVSVYRTLAGIPGAELSAELKPVFDAMLATEDQLAAVRRREGQPLTAKQLGVTEQQRAEQLEQEADDYTEGSARAQLAAVKDALRAREAWWKAGLKKLEVNFADEYEQLPARRAQRLISGEETGEAMVLDRAAVQEVIGDLKVPSLRTAETGGVRPSFVAELAGYASPRAMPADLAGLRPKETWVRAQADAAMRQLHPGILDDLTKFRALLSDGLRSATEKRLEREVQGLPREALKRAAEKLVERREVGKLQPGRALGQQRQAAAAKARAMMKGDIAATRDAAHAELLNHYLHHELKAAAEQVGKVEDLAKRLGKASARERLGKASPAYRDAVDFLRGAFGFGDPTDLDAGTLDAAVAQLEGDAITIGDPEWLAPVRAALAKGDYRKLTVAQLGQVRDALKMMEAGARQRTEVLVDGKSQDFDSTIRALIAEAESYLRKQPPKREKHAQGKAERALRMITAFDGYLGAPVEFLRDLTNDNPESMTWKALALPFKRAVGREADLMKTGVEPFMKAMEAMPKEVRASALDAVDGRAFFPQHSEDYLPTRRIDLWMIALNAGNESNLQRLLARGMTREQVFSMIDTFDAAVLQWLQGVWDSAESLKDESFALEERITGLRPAAIEPVPIKAKNGTLRGGYFPAKAIRGDSVVGEMQGVAGLFDPNYIRPGTVHGHTKSRSEGASYRLSLDPAIIPGHLRQVAHDIAFREAVMSFARLIMNEDYKRALQERLGEEKWQQLYNWAKDIGGASATDQSPPTQLLQVIRQNMTPMMLSGMSTALGNFSNFAMTVATTKVKSKHLAAASWQWLHSASARAAVVEKSGTIRAMENEVLQGFERQMLALTSSKAARSVKRLQEAALWFSRTIDSVTTKIAWLAAYRQKLAETDDDGAAVRFADDIATQIAPSASPVERAALLRDPHFWGKIAQFGSFISRMYQAAHRKARPLFSREFESGGFSRKGWTLAKVTGGFMGMVVAYGLLNDLFAGRGPEDGDRDEEDPENKLLKWRNWFARKLLGQSLSLTPFFPGQAVVDSAALQKPVTSRSDPLTSTLSLVGETVMKGASGQLSEEQFLKRMAQLSGLLGGAPLRLGNTSGRYVYDVLAGDEDPASIWEFISNTVYGKRPGNPEDIFTLMGDLFGS